MFFGTVAAAAADAAAAAAATVPKQKPNLFINN